MDAFEHQIKQKKAKRLGWILLAVTAGLSALAICIYLFLFSFGGFRVELTLLGPGEMTVPYGTPFEDPGCRAQFLGTYLVTGGKEAAVTVQGNVNDRKTGTYELTYRAEFGPWHGETTRKVHIVDDVSPKIMLVEDPGTYVLPGEIYQEEGYVARDNYDGDLTDQVLVAHKINKIVYTVSDSSGNTTQVERQIVYYDPVPPGIYLEGDLEITLSAGVRYQEPGFRATDNFEGDLTDRVQIQGEVNIYRKGTYTLTYTVKDRYGNTASAQRTIRVTGSGQPDIVTPSGKVIYLTFDDGPGPYTRELLDVLKKYNVKATFFVVSTKYLYLVEDMIQEGHSVGIHSVSHDYDEIYSSEEAYFKDLFRMQELIEKYSGVKTTLVRFPGGSSNTVSKFNKGIMSRLTAALTDMGFQYFDWNVDSRDAGGTKDSEGVAENIIDGISGRRVSIVLQHDIKPYSVDAVEDVILWALEHGYRFLPLDPTSPNAHQNVRN